MYKVTSEIYKETNFQPVKSNDGKVISKFAFYYPSNVAECVGEKPAEDHQTFVDADGDLLVQRRTSGVIEIEHSESTELSLVGLQVWRGALLLADYFFHCRADLKDKQVLELGAGVGLTSIAAAIYAKKVICSDVDIGGILNLIRGNVKRNGKLIKSHIDVMEFDFMQNTNEYSTTLMDAIDKSEIIVAADVIYSDELTDAFIRVIDGIFQREAVSGIKKTLFVALEKRYVFTLNELDSVAPMFEYFLKQTLKKSWRFENLATNFPQYFIYERCKELVLFKLTSS